MHFTEGLHTSRIQYYATSPFVCRHLAQTLHAPIEIIVIVDATLSKAAILEQQSKQMFDIANVTGFTYCSRHVASSRVIRYRWYIRDLH